MSDNEVAEPASDTFIDKRGYLMCEVEHERTTVPHIGKEKDGAKVLDNGDRLVWCTIPAADLYQPRFSHHHIITYCEETGKVESTTLSRYDFNQCMAHLYASSLAYALSVMMPLFLLLPLFMTFAFAAYDESPFVEWVEFMFSYADVWGEIGFKVYCFYVIAMLAAFFLSYVVFSNGGMKASVVLHRLCKQNIPPKNGERD